MNSDKYKKQSPVDVTDKSQNKQKQVTVNFFFIFLFFFMFFITSHLQHKLEVSVQMGF